MAILETGFLGNPLKQWVMAFGGTTLVLAVFYGFRTWMMKRLDRFASRTKTHWDDVIFRVLASTKPWFMTVLAAYLGSKALQVAPHTASNLNRILLVALLIQMAVWGNTLIRYLTDYYLSHSSQALPDGKPDGSHVTTVRGIAFLAHVVFFTLLLLWGLDNFGVNITTLVAGLGVGGVAIALAVQSILKDLFSSLSIVLDKPFVVGDYIVLGDFQGTVEKIGIKTTRLKSLSGEQLVFPNSDLLESRVRNFKRMQERRIDFKFGVLYTTEIESLKQIPDMVREIISRQERARFERAHLATLGDSSLDFEIVYWVTDPDFGVYRDVHQAINLELLQKLGSRKISIAFPTRTIELNLPSEVFSALGQRREMRREVRGDGGTRERTPVEKGR